MLRSSADDYRNSSAEACRARWRHAVRTEDVGLSRLSPRQHCYHSSSPLCCSRWVPRLPYHRPTSKCYSLRCVNSPVAPSHLFIGAFGRQQMDRPIRSSHAVQTTGSIRYNTITLRTCNACATSCTRTERLCHDKNSSEIV